MKGVAWLRKASVRCLATFDPEISEWGNPIVQNTITRFSGSNTWGSETSQYPEEKKKMLLCSNIPLVAASEKGNSPNQVCSLLYIWGCRGISSGFQVLGAMLCASILGNR